MTDDLDDFRDEEGLDESIYPVKCECGWFGMSDDVSYMRCPDCGSRVTKDAFGN
jgi:predicted Zn-ribbon and HTH transcriptional regulator